MQCLLACRVKFIHIARFFSYVADGTESFLVPTRRPKNNLVGALCHDLVVGALYSKVKQSLGSVCVSLTDFSGFICEVEHPSEADDQKRVFSFPFDFTRTCNTHKEKRVVWLLTGDASD